VEEFEVVRSEGRNGMGVLACNVMNREVYVVPIGKCKNNG
jgi:hypothetical protein